MATLTGTRGYRVVTKRRLGELTEIVAFFPPFNEPAITTRELAVQRRAARLTAWADLRTEHPDDVDGLADAFRDGRARMVVLTDAKARELAANAALVSDRDRRMAATGSGS